MKHAHSNPSRSEILTWLNSHLQPTISPIKKIEELGSGVAYLFLLVALRPGIVRSDKIIKYPTNHNEYLHNLKMLGAAMEKLQLPIKIEPDKLAQMKYQENYYLCCFLYKHLTVKGEQPDPVTDTKENSNNSHQSNRLKRFKVIPPEKIIPTKLQKEESPTMAMEDLEGLHMNSGMKLKKIEIAMQENKPNQQKLTKIAAILNLKSNKHHQHIATNTIQSGSINNPLSVQASYKRFLRPSLCQQSSLLNKNKSISFEKAKVEASPAKVMEPLRNKEELIFSSTNEPEGEMLLSQRKDESQKQEEVASVNTCLMGEVASEGQKGGAEEQLYPLI